VGGGGGGGGWVVSGLVGGGWVGVWGCKLKGSGRVKLFLGTSGVRTSSRGIRHER